MALFNFIGRDILDLVGIYLLWIVLHFIAANLYVELCTPRTLRGLLLSPFVAPMPQCKAFRWLIYNGGNNIEAMWFVLGVMIIKKLLPVKTKNDNDNDNE